MDRRELLIDALQEFIDNLPNDVEPAEISWIIFNTLGARGMLCDWSRIKQLIDGSIDDYYIHHVLDQREEMLSAQKDADDFLGRIVNDV